MKTDELETMMSMLLEGGDMVSVLEPIPDDLAQDVAPKSTAKKAVGCTAAEEKCCELV